MLTNSTLAYKISSDTIVEVANVISTVSEQAIAGTGKGRSPKDAVFAKRWFPGTVQNMYRTVIGYDGALLWGGDVVSRPMFAT